MAAVSQWKGKGDIVCVHVCGLYLKWAVAGKVRFSHRTEETTSSCWTLSSHAPRLTPQDRGASACTSPLLRTPRMHRDHTALFSNAGP